MIIARYLIKDIAQTLFGVCLVLMLIGLSGQLVELIGEVTAGGYTLQAGGDSIDLTKRRGFRHFE